VEAVIAATSWVAFVVFALYGWDVAVSLGGLWSLPRPRESDRSVRFAVIVCAHNEASVVAGVVNSLRAQHYPRELVDVFVVADNCTDDTAAVAADAGALVLERHDLTKRTKGYALQWGMDHVIARGPYDAVCVLDADNVAAPSFLATMRDYLAAGHRAIQGYLDIKNPDATWVTRCIALSYYLSNRTFMRARTRLGLPATLGGTGFCLDWDVFVAHRWDPGSLADDLELTMRLILARVPVTFGWYARTYDEKPTTLRLSLRQRSRWMQGHHDVAFRWVAKMAWQTVRRPSIACFDATLHLLQPMRLLVAAVCGVILGTTALLAPDLQALDGAFRFGWPAAIVAGGFFVVHPLAVAIAERRGIMFIKNALPVFLYSFTWIPAVVVGLVRVRRRVWVHTAHGVSPGKA
jgi:cellulose synthase/poly-beta-1,6-N-acetylglucosamine synthase-like glycosyltransferase